MKNTTKSESKSDARNHAKSIAILTTTSTTTITVTMSIAISNASNYVGTPVLSRHDGSATRNETSICDEERMYSCCEV
jgi:hypothetical protein